MAKKKAHRKVKMSVNNIKTVKTPMLKDGNRASKPGKRFRLGISLFIHKLFEINEKKPQSQKMTDGEIARQIRVEYSEYPEVVARFEHTNPDIALEISRHRSEYNTGRLTYAKAPPEKHLVSFTYDIDGFKVNPRYAEPKRMTKEEIEKVREKYYVKYRKPYEDDLKKASQVK